MRWQVLVLLCLQPISAVAAEVSTSPLSIEVRARQLGTADSPGPLRRALEQIRHEPGDQVFLRIFKQTSAPGNSLTPIGKGTLEVWLSAPSGRFELFRSYPVAKYSGKLGPKLKEGDEQAPEGFYGVNAERMNPWSKYHLAMNLGYPNALDQSLGRTGDFIMIHGGLKSVGCFAMTDPGIEEIYVLAEAALNAGQREVPVHAFPFPLIRENLMAASTLRWISFWNNLSQGFELFESDWIPPIVTQENGRYVFEHGFTAP